MNDKQLLEKKLNICKKRESFLAGIFLMGMLFVGGYIFKLPYKFGIPVLVILAVCFVLMIWNSITIRMIKKRMELENFPKIEG